MKNNNYCIIMAGGVGSRFWPMSTPQKPKQFLDVLGIGKSLIQMTYERLLSIAPSENIYVVTNASYAEIVKEQLPDLSYGQILTEPKRKNTAPCIAYASAKIKAINPEATLIISPADHLIMKENRFTEILNTAIAQANSDDRLVTLGIQPTRPDTGYGYIEFSSESGVKAGQVTPVKQFREKPDHQTAEQFLKSGNFYWNSGIFVWRAGSILKALEQFQPGLYDLFAGDPSFYNTTDEQLRIDQCFDLCEDISIDFAIMEHAKNVDVVLADFDWSDLGTWGSLSEHLKKDDNNNSVIGEHAHLFHSTNCLVNIPSDKLVLLDGLNDYIVVESDNMLMVLRSKNEQELKNFLKIMEAKSPQFFKQ
jgi:mannose-1-phosphate guanylyltransferase